jgi:hypothetical protein
MPSSISGRIGHLVTVGYRIVFLVRYASKPVAESFVVFGPDVDESDVREA